MRNVHRCIIYSAICGGLGLAIIYVYITMKIMSGAGGYLPKYSPDFNPIEKVFAVIKKRRQYAEHNTSLDHLVKTYENYLV